MGDTKAKKRRILPVVVVAAAVAVTAVLALNFAVAPDTNFESMEQGRAQSKSEELQTRLQELADKNMFGFSLNTNPVFENGEATLFIKNDAANRQPFVVSIKLDDTGEEVYRCAPLPPGGEVIRDRLRADLPPGEYPATAYIEGVAEDGSPPVQMEAAMLVTVR